MLSCDTQVTRCRSTFQTFLWYGDLGTYFDPFLQLLSTKAPTDPVWNLLVFLYLYTNNEYWNLLKTLYLKILSVYMDRPSNGRKEVFFLHVDQWEITILWDWRSFYLSLPGTSFITWTNSPGPKFSHLFIWGRCLGASHATTSPLKFRAMSNALCHFCPPPGHCPGAPPQSHHAAAPQRWRGSSICITWYGCLMKMDT